MKTCDYVHTFISVAETTRDVWRCLRDFVLPDLDHELTPEQANVLLGIHRNETLFTSVQEKVEKVISGEGVRESEIVQQLPRTQTLASYHLKNLWQRCCLCLTSAG